MSIFSFLRSKKSKSFDTIKLLSPLEFIDRIEGKKVQLIDVRTPKEFASDRIKGAKNINLFSKHFITEIDALDKSKPVYVYCRSGGRSKQASRKIAKLGFTEIYDLKVEF